MEHRREPFDHGTRHVTGVERGAAAGALHRTVEAMLACATPVVLADAQHRLVLQTVTWSPHLQHPAARELGVLDGHVVDHRSDTVAVARVHARIDEGLLVLDASSPSPRAAGALATGVALLAREVRSWAQVASVVAD